MTDQAKGRVIWAEGPPPDGVDGEWLVELLGRYRHVGRWKRDAWETPVGHVHGESITRHAAL